MSKVLRDLKSLGKSNAEVVSDLKTLTNKGCKIKDQEIIHHGSGGYTKRIRRSYNKDQEIISRIFFGIGATICIGQEIL